MSDIAPSTSTHEEACPAWVLEEFRAAEALLHGHFILSSGLHSDTYIQCARALMDPARAEKLCGALAKKLEATLGKEALAQLDVVVSPAMGGVVVGYEMGRQLGKQAMFCERSEGAFALRRGFALKPGARVLLVEDVVTTGKSSLEAVACLEEAGAKIVAEACLINRSGQQDPVGDIPLIALAKLEVATFAADAVPAHLQDTPAEKPGSRWLKR